MHYNIQSEMVKLKKPVTKIIDGSEVVFTKQLVLVEDIEDFYDDIYIEAGTKGAYLTEFSEVDPDGWLPDSCYVIGSDISKTYAEGSIIINSASIFNTFLDTKHLSRDPSRDKDIIPVIENSTIKGSTISFGEFTEFSKTTWYLQNGIWHSTIINSEVYGLCTVKTSSLLKNKLIGEICITDADVANQIIKGKLEIDGNVNFDAFSLKAGACYFENDIVITFVDFTSSAMYKDVVCVFINDVNGKPIQYLNDAHVKVDFSNVYLDNIQEAIADAYLPDNAKKFIKVTTDYYKSINGLD